MNTVDKETGALPENKATMNVHNGNVQTDVMWDLSRVPQWGMGYFNADQDGDISVCPNPELPDNKVKLLAVVKQVNKKIGMQFPILFCFPQILQHRLKTVNDAFKKAREDFGYQGEYFLVYPIKVNQSKRVV